MMNDGSTIMLAPGGEISIGDVNSDRTYMSTTYEIVGCGAGKLTHSHAGEESSATVTFDRPC